MGVLIDRRLRELTLVSTVSALALGIWNEVPAAIYMAVGVWGIAFGGAATLFQTAIATAAGEAADVARPCWPPPGTGLSLPAGSLAAYYWKRSAPEHSLPLCCAFSFQRSLWRGPYPRARRSSHPIILAEVGDLGCVEPRTAAQPWKF